MEPAVHEEAGVVIDDQEQAGPNRNRHLRVRDERTDENIGVPPGVPGFGLEPAEHLRFRSERFAMQPAAAKLGTDSAFRDPHPVAVPHHVSDLRRGPCRQLDPQRGDNISKLGMRTDGVSIGPLRWCQPGQTLTPPPQNSFC